MIVKLRQITTFLPAVFLLLNACGAPLKNANDVYSVFTVSKKLKSKVQTLCQNLKEQQAAPRAVDIVLFQEACASAGDSYVEYSRLGPKDSLHFVDQRSETKTLAPSPAQPEGETILSTAVRSEIFLNRNLLVVANKLFKMLATKTGNNSAIERSDFTITFIGKPVFNADTFEFSWQFTANSPKTANGQVDFNNHFALAGKMFGQDSFAVSVETMEDGVVENTILHRARILILLVPHANDIFMSIVGNQDFFSFEVDPVFKNVLFDALGAVVKAFPSFVTDIQ